MRPIDQRWLVLLAAAVFVFVVSSADLGQMPAPIAAVYNYPNGDKLGHFLLMGLLAFLVNLGISCRTVRLGRWQLLLGSLLTAAVSLLEEFSQIFFAHRTFSLIDLAFSLLGIWLLGGLARRVRMGE